MSPRRLAARTSCGRALAALAASAGLLAALAPAGASAAECPNEALRVGASAHLPECRAYEVVSPDTGHLAFFNAIGTWDQSNNMSTWFGSPDGESVIIDTEGAVQDEDANGGVDRYESIRTPQGWKMSVQGPSGAQTGDTTPQGGSVPRVGGASPDHQYSFWDIGGGSNTAGGGTLAPGVYLHERDGGFTPLAFGTLGIDTSAEGVWITEGGSHVIFTTAPARPFGDPVQLEPNAPPSPAGAIYDRPVGGPTHVVSLLPGDATPGSTAQYLGVSKDGTDVAFEVNGTMYVRRNNAATQAAAYAQPGTKLNCFANSSQWLRNGLPIAGATGSIYTVQPADAGKAIQCQVTVAGSAVSTSVPPTLITTTAAPIAPPQLHYPLAAPTPANPTAGTSETCPAGAWSGSPTLAYQWYGNGAPIAGATSATYEVQGADVPSTLQCSVSASNADGTVLAFSAVAPTDPAPVGAKAAPLVNVSGVTLPDTHSPGSVVNFSGFSPGGERVFYSRGPEAAIKEGYDSIDFFDSATSQTGTAIAHAGGGLWPIQVSEDGSHLYFVSTAVLTPGEKNSQGAEAVAPASGKGTLTNGSTTVTGVTAEEGTFRVGMGIRGSGFTTNTSIVAVGAGTLTLSQPAQGSGVQEFTASMGNLYAWSGGSPRLIGTVFGDDLFGKHPAGPITVFSGLKLWNAGLNSLVSTGPGENPSRTTPDGSVLVFQSGANLIPAYDSLGHSEIFRYDDNADQLSCVSCNPDGTAATTDAELQTISPNVSERKVGNQYTFIPNVTPDGEMVVFNTAERLLPEDEDNFYDVYRWRDGELALISGGQSIEHDFLLGMSTDGRDLFFVGYDSLAPQDQDGGVRSIYDARIDGGFPPPVTGAVCEEEGCQGALAVAPALSTAATPGFQGAGNTPEKRSTHKKHKKKKKHAKKKRHAHKGKGGKR